MDKKKKRKLGSLLLEYGLISDGELDEALTKQKLSGLRLGETLIKLGKLTEENIDWMLSKQFDIPFVIIEHVVLDKDLIIKLPKELLIKNRILPLYESDKEIYIVTDDIFNYTAFAYIEKSMNKKVDISLGNAKKIEKVLIEFFNSEPVPSFICELQKIIEKIRDSSFYRIDIILAEHKCEFHIYGFRILKKIMTLDIELEKNDVLKAFDLLQIPFMYSICENHNNVFLSIYILKNKIDDILYPAVLGINGLLLPEETTFSDINNSKAPHLLYCQNPVYGYPYISTRSRTTNYKKIIYTVDSVPDDLRKFYLKAYIPEKCGFCLSNGCEKCMELGYTFKLIEGMYASEDLKKCYREIFNS